MNAQNNQGFILGERYDIRVLRISTVRYSRGCLRNLTVLYGSEPYRTVYTC